MNEYIMFGLYGIVIMMFLDIIKIIIYKEDLSNLRLNLLAFGFVIGSVGKRLIDELINEIYINFPKTTIFMIFCFVLGILGSTINLVFFSRHSSFTREKNQ